MSRVIHARIDDVTEKQMRKLGRSLGWSDSQIVREGIKLLAGFKIPGAGQSIIGLGKFRSKIPDLGSNKEHLTGFGR